MSAFLTSGWTEHARWKPVAHAFRYPVVYLTCDIDKIGVDKFSLGPCSVRNQDLLRTFDLESTRVRDRLTKLLFQRNMLLASTDRVYVTTMPRWLGYAFNPVNAYFCYASTSDTLKFVVLEVNNTFGESHIYCLDVYDAKKTSRKGFDFEWDVERHFHVSPFNDRTGSYKIFINTPNFSLQTTSIDIRIMNYHDIHENNSKYFTGSLSCSTQPLTSMSLLWMSIWYPFTIFLTFPRILYQAFLLAYFRSLPIFPRPNPRPPNTIYHLPPDLTEKLSLSLLDSSLTTLTLSDRHRNLSEDNFNTLTLTIGTQTNSYVLAIPTSLHISLSSFDVVVWWMVLASTSDFAVSITRDEIIFENGFEDEDLLISIIGRCQGECGTNSNQYVTKWKRWLTNEPDSGTGQVNNDVVGNEASMGWDVLIKVVFALVMITMHHVVFHLITPWKEGREPEPWKKMERMLQKLKAKEVVGK